MNPQQERAAVLTAIANGTPLPYLLDVSDRPHRIAARAARHTWHSWPVFLARYHVRETWRGIPGPWPVKLALTAVAIAEPGPFGELALAAFGKVNGARKARKAAGR